MGLISWIILGLIAGFLASLIAGGGFGLLELLILGIVGAVVGGFIAQALGFGEVSGIDVRSIVIAVVGAIIVIAVVRMLRGSRATV
jgi:uncharacterized membrane protein YeaQ/YmgE (transglycosylase-associated protein family)